MSATHVIGIDLGTSNCAVAFALLAEGTEAIVRDFPIPQLQRPGQVAPQPLLPSSLYTPAAQELPPGSSRLPWETDLAAEPAFIVGEFARWQGARVPGRLISSSKSWLCHPGVDRTAAILPWGAPADVPKLSPLDASARLLKYLAQAWDAAHPEAPLATQEIVLTVPASFDEVARALTVSAAQQAGFKTFTLVEEPQAAFYAFTAHQGAKLADALDGVRLVLVVDVGGGTTDFTLVQISLGEDGPVLKRIAVGDHVMLGGDNMDAALARRAEDQLRIAGHKLDAHRWTQLVQAARVAKETLLAAEAPERVPLTLAAAGSRLIGGTLATQLTRNEAETLVLDGFFPPCAPDEAPRRPARVALQELGLPYAQDPAVTRHLAAFLQKHAAAGFAALGTTADTPNSPLPRPDAILLNGGVFASPRLATRLLDVVSSWWPDAPRSRALEHDSLALAVAHGAARYGLVRHGLGRRIGGGAAQALYLGLQTHRNDDNNVSTAVCILPRGHEEGRTIELTARPFTLAVGQPVQFPLHATTADRVDLPGDIVTIDDTFRALPPLHTLFRATETGTRNVPVHLRANLTELGTLELWCVAATGDENWRLEFELRAAAARATTTVVESMPARFAEVRTIIDRFYGPAASPADPKALKQLSTTLETALGPREGWHLPLLRELWSALFAGAARRRRSALHERLFFRLLGYALRPGFGYPLDAWRCEQTFCLFAESVHFHTENATWNEFWILWRRVAGGLNETHHTALWNYLKPHLARRIPPQPSKNAPRPKGVQPEGMDEMVRTAASLEHLDPAEKIVLGHWIDERLRAPAGTASGPWSWALGRLGARVPVYGGAHRTVPIETATAWLTLLLDKKLRAIDGAPFAATQLARLTGDRTRDLEPELRARTATALTQADAPARWLRLIEEVVVLEADDEARALGDTLPLGLKLA